MQDAAAGEELAFPDDAVEVGRVVGAWGVKGGIKVKPFSPDPQALVSCTHWFLQAPASLVERATPPPPWPRLLRVRQVRGQGDHVVAAADDLFDRDAAQALAGARIFVSRSTFPTPAADEFYWVDLIGLVVRNREGIELGTVVGLAETGPTCVLRVLPPCPDGDESAQAHERLIPFVSTFVDRVDLAGRCLHVDWQLDY